jgi:CrcB protein
MWIGVGGFVGSVSRYGIALWSARVFGSNFPYGTLIINIGGSLLMGVMMCIGVKTTILGPTAKLALTTGLLGGFTTYSAFSYETLVLLQQRSWTLATLNIVATVAVCLIAVALGWAFGSVVFPGRA